MVYNELCLNWGLFYTKYQTSSIAIAFNDGFVGKTCQQWR